MAVTNWLIDKSAYTRLVASPDAQAWVERIERVPGPQDLTLLIDLVELVSQQPG